MLILTLDASSVSASAALCEDGRILYEAYVHNGLTHSTSLMPMVADCFRYGGKSIEQVDAIGVVAGPGSFTGVRIAVATAMGLAGDRPCIALNTLDVLARQAAHFGEIICPLLDARASQVYCAAYRNGQMIHPHGAEKLSDFLCVLKGFGGNCLFVGDGAAAYKDALLESGIGTIAQPWYLGVHAGTAGQMAFEKSDSFVQAKDLRPIYLRRPQAERERLKRMEKGG